MTANIWRVALLAATGAALAPGSASAKLLVITSGNTITHLAKLQLPPMTPEPAPKGKAPKAGPNIGLPGPGVPGGMPDLGSMQIGYKWDYGGIFWIDFWTWGGEYCLYTGKEYFPIPPELAAKLTGRDSPPSRPFLYKFPLGLLILGGVGLFVVVRLIVVSRKELREEREDDDLDQYRMGRKGE